MKFSLENIAMGASLVVAILMLVGKLTAYYVSGSAAILSDAAESVIHIVATAIAAFSLWYARQPSDTEHPYGHGKIAYFSAGFEGALISIAGLYIIYVAVRSLIVGPELRDLGTGLLITAILALINLVLGAFLVVVGKKKNSVILEANGRHVLTDMWTSLAVVVGVGIVFVTDIEWLDPVVALLAGVNILGSALKLIRRAFAGLLDEADVGSTERILECLQEATDQNHLSGFHQLRHRTSNDTMWVEVHMLVPGHLTTSEAHEKVTTVERNIEKLFPTYIVHITSHVEPFAHDQAHPEGHPDLNDPFEEHSVPGPEDRG